MFDLLIGLARFALGISLAVTAIAFAWVSFRAAFYGSAAYEANRSITDANIKQTFLGRMRPERSNSERRSTHGLAIDLRTMKLLPQRRLSNEAIDDVIGRSV